MHLIDRVENTISNLNMKKFGRIVILPETEFKNGLTNNRIGINSIGIIEYIQKQEQPKESLNKVERYCLDKYTM